MSAKEMFKKLGLQYLSIDYIGEQPERIMYHDNNGTRIIITKTYIESVLHYNDSALNIKYLPAIIQQLKEYGWYE